MFKAIRLTILLLILFFVTVSTWLSQSRSTDWNNSLWVKIYPINGDGSDASGRYIDSLTEASFAPIESFVAREMESYGHSLARPVRMELGAEIGEQPPHFGASPNVLDIMLWSLKIRWWASSVAGPTDDPAPDVRIFVRYHAPDGNPLLEDSVGFPLGFAEPDRIPRYPQRFAEIMGGRIPVSTTDAMIPNNLKNVVIGNLTAEEIRLVE